MSYLMCYSLIVRFFHALSRTIYQDINTLTVVGIPIVSVLEVKIEN